MIVRIQEDNQYRLDDQHGAEVEHLDERLTQAIQQNDTDAFTSTLQEVVAFIQREGTPVANDEVVTSDLIIPAADMSLDEAREALAKAEVE